MKKLIITADDFGFTSEINRGIIETVENGVTTEVSLMMNSYGTVEAMKYAKNHTWDNIGVHLSLFNIDKNEKPYHSVDYERGLVSKSSKELTAIIFDELKKFEDFFGRKPSHVNGHKHLHFNPKVIDFIFNYTQDRIYVRKWGDFESETTIPADLDFVKAKFAEYHIKTSDYLFGFEYDFNHSVNVVPKYQQILQSVRDNQTTEILFHPGYCGEFEASLTRFLQEREADRILLCSKEMRDMLTQLGFTLSPAI